MQRSCKARNNFTHRQRHIANYLEKRAAISLLKHALLGAGCPCKSPFSYQTILLQKISVSARN
jgi:hypothetical protein